MLRLARRRSKLSGLRPASSVVDEMKREILAKQQADAPRIMKLKKQFAYLHDAAVDAVYGGRMRDIVHDPSLLDAQEGIRFRGLTIPECQEKLPKGADGTEPLPEAMFWLLLTGNVPTADQVARLNAEVQARADPDVIEAARKAVEGLPVTAHPMTQFRTGMLALRTASKFSAAYAAGNATNDDDWELALEDSLDCVARSPHVAAMKCKEASVDMTNSAALEKFMRNLLNAKRVVPGVGYEVPRKSDARYSCQRDFAARNFPNDELLLLLDAVYSITPEILTKHCISMDRFPANVDMHSGMLLQHFGLTQLDFYSVSCTACPGSSASFPASSGTASRAARSSA